MHVSPTVAAFLLITAVAAEAAPFHVVSGQPIKLHFSYAVNPDCSPRGEITVRVTSSPQHGQVSIVRAQDFPSFVNENPRSICNRRRVPGVSLRYVSQRGFIGSDSFAVETVYPDGILRQNEYTIDVR